MTDTRKPIIEDRAQISNPFLATREEAQRQAKSDQDRNRLWWEMKPMTYAPWEADNRTPVTREDFEAMEEYLLGKSPFLREEFAPADLAGKRALDLGSGSGVLSCYTARYGANVTAVDITDQGTRLTTRNAALRDIPIEVVRADAEAMPFPEASFDYVFSWGVLHHSRRTERALAEVARVLAPGGHGLMMVYHRNSLIYFLKGLYWLFVRGRILRGEGFADVTDRYSDGYYHRHFSARELGACLADAGLRPTRLMATQQEEPILPSCRGGLDRWLKKKLGWYLVAEFERPRKQ